jgi:competence protein ComEC
MSIAVIGDAVDEGSALSRSARWVRLSVAHGARSMGEDERALFTGLVIGDDTRQPRSMVASFRASGLGHLCAVSGQNVAYVLVVFGIALRRLRPTARLVATAMVVGWFVVVTRVEPSVVRAGAMAIAAAWSFHRGHQRAPVDVLAMSSLVALFIDPMLGWSVGFLLSVTASLGLVTLSGPLSRIIAPRQLATVLAPALAAQIATAPIAITTFGQLPVIALAANCVATPLAGVVMLVGLPLAIIAARLPDLVAATLMAPLEALVRCVWWTAAVAERVSPRGVWNVVAWVVVAVVVVYRTWRTTRASESSDRVVATYVGGRLFGHR